MPDKSKKNAADKLQRLREVSDRAFQMLGSCSLCPRHCRVDRLSGEKGFCRTGLKPRVYNFLPHHGEEPPISGSRGSGTIFFSGCNLACVYCQNYAFSQLGEGREVETAELADFMLQLQERGCHNINLVTPTHVMPQILQALLIAIPAGLDIPIIYNTGGYELPEVIKLLEGIVDVYLPDARYADEKAAVEYSSAPGYPEFNRRALKEMHRQAGIPQFDADGVIVKGMIIRHLVLPNGIAGTEKTMEFISRELSPETYISLMSQYTPYHQAAKFAPISRGITAAEYENARQAMEAEGLFNGWVQDDGGLERFAGVNLKPGC